MNWNVGVNSMNPLELALLAAITFFLINLTAFVGYYAYNLLARVLDRHL